MVIMPIHILVKSFNQLEDTAEYSTPGGSLLDPGSSAPPCSTKKNQSASLQAGKALAQEGFSPTRHFLGRDVERGGNGETLLASCRHEQNSGPLLYPHLRFPAIGPFRQRRLLFGSQFDFWRDTRQDWTP
jgi:hypothetical protein